MYSITPQDVPTKKFYGLMTSTVGPRPIAFASTVDEAGNPNLSPFSFFNMFSANPPILVFSPLRRIAQNTEKHTLKNARATKEVVINIVGYDLVHQMSLASTGYGDGVNEFEKSGLTMKKSELVKPFRVAESLVQFECKVNQVVSMGKEGGAGNLLICEVLKMHIDDKILTDDKKIDQHKLDLVSRMGGNWYSRAATGMFEVPKPISTMGMGIDQLPTEIKNSKYLSGNDLGMLGTLENLPQKEEVAQFVKVHELNGFLAEKSEKETHMMAHEYLENNEVENAVKLLLAKIN